MAATTGLGLDSIFSSTLCRSGGWGGLPNSRISAPAMKVRPPPMMTRALTPGSSIPLARPSISPWRTPWASALTGGLLTVMAPGAPRLRLHEPDPGDFGIGEDDRRDGDIVEGGNAPRDGLGGHLALAHGPVGEHGIARHVAHRVDVRIGGPAPLVHGDEPAPFDLDLRGLQA